jgi:hypothetical protein
MVRLACELAEAKGATLFLVDGAVLRPGIIYNLPQEYIEGIGTVRVGSQCCGRAVESKKPWIVTDMLSDPLFAEGRNGAVSSPIRAAFSVPVPHTPSQLDIERNQVFAKLIAITLHSTPPASVATTPVFVPRFEAGPSAAAH